MSAERTITDCIARFHGQCKCVQPVAPRHIGITSPDFPGGRWTCQTCKRQWLNHEKPTCECPR